MSISMRRWRAAPHLIAALAFLALPAICSTALAQECFCLRHTSGAMLHGCVRQEEVYVCVDPYTTKKISTPVRPEWKRVDCGSDCVVKRPPLELQPRSPDK
jgi:hypothetical protein